MEDLIHASVLNREGKKWKQRWAVLKRVSKSKQGTQDGAHAKEQKKKSVLPLDFCGLETCSDYDKAKNVLILITPSSTVYLSFDQLQVREKWKQLLVEYFGTGVSYAIVIPDKQKFKPGEATIRLYRTFFSIITEKNYRCLNRWYINDISRYSYSPTDPSIFSFEVRGPSLNQKGPVVDLSIPDHAEEVAKAFDFVMSQSNNESTQMIHNDFHGSAMLDELDQARRNVGDKNFFRRVMLRASDRMRKKKRIRTQSDGYRKKGSRAAPSGSDFDTGKFSSIDRRPFHRVDVSANNTSFVGVLRSTSVQVSKSNPKQEKRAMQPLPTEQVSINSKKHSTPSTPVSQKKTTMSDNTREAKSTKENPVTKPRSMTTNDLSSYDNTLIVEQPKISRSVETISEKKTCSGERVKVVSSSTDKLASKEVDTQNIDMHISASDKSVISDRQVRTSADSYTSATYNPAMRVLMKGKKVSNTKNLLDDLKTPTPPPRSPVSLGVSVFEYPSFEDMTNGKPDDSSSLLNEINEIFEERKNVLNSDVSDDAFASAEPSPLMYNNNLQKREKGEPIYGNVATRNHSDSQSLNDSGVVRRQYNYRRGSTKHLSDPLMIEKWREATGDGKVSSLRDLPLTPTDYVNVRGTQHMYSDDDNDKDSYVNVTSELGKRKKNIPPPLAINDSYVNVTSELGKRNDFAKYDDDDLRIYHDMKVLDCDSTHSDGSYENMNAPRMNPRLTSDYWNVLSPSSSSGRMNSSNLNYVMVGKPDMFMHPVSPKKQTPKSPVETFDKTNYTTIDANATVALKRTMDYHTQQRETRTPTKTPK